MDEIYAYATPNSIKVLIALEELGLDYTLHTVNVKQGEQQTPAFRALNANGKVPVLVHTDTHTPNGSDTSNASNTSDTEQDTHRLVLSESAAILVYLAEREQQLLPTAGTARARVFEQLFFHASAVSPSFGNAGYFTRLADTPQPLAMQRFNDEARRVTALLDHVLAERPYVAGEHYSIADIAHFGWFWRHARHGVPGQAAF